VVQVNFYSGFVSQQYRDAQKADRAGVKGRAGAEGQGQGRRAKSEPGRDRQAAAAYADRIPRPPFSALIDQIDHIAKVAGVDHVGLGSDFDGISGSCRRASIRPADLPKITAALMERGYSAEDCRKILGGNLLRVFREVEQVSQSSCRPKTGRGSR
jgi:membrane dipeptidase